MRTHTLRSGAHRYAYLLLAALLLGAVVLGFARPARAAENGESEWKNVGETISLFSSGLRPSMAISNGTPYVAYNVGGGFVAKYANGAWSTLSEVRPGNYPTDMTLKIHNGTLYVGYLDALLGRDYGYATVTKYNGTYWPRMGNAASAGDARYMSMDLYNGTPYIACTDQHNLVVKKFSGLEWANVGASGIVYAGDAENTVLKVDSIAGTPYVAFSAGNTIYVYRFVSGVWTPVGEPITALTVPHLTMAVNGGKVYVGTYGTVYMSDGAAWTALGNPGALANSSSNFDLALYSGTPYYVFTDEQNSGQITLKKYAGSAWENVGPASSHGSSPALAFDGGGVPYIVFVNNDGIQVQKLVSSGTQPGGATGTVVNASGNVNVRKGPGTGYAVIGSARKGETYSVLGQSGEWYKIDYKGKTGYINASYLSVSSEPPVENPPGDTQTGTVTNATGNVNVRKGPGTGYAVIGSARKGESYTVLGQSGEWYKIDYKGKTGYISASYLLVSSEPPAENPSDDTRTGTVANATGNVNVRSGPGTGYAVIGSARKGETYTVSGQSGEWYKIDYKGKTGYISASYLLVSSEPPAENPPDDTRGTVTNATGNVNVRSGPGTGYAVIGSARKGETYTVLGQSGEWYKIDYKGKTGYINASYFSVNND